VRWLFEERDEFKRGAFYDAPSVAKRAKQRILSHADKVLDLQYDYEEARVQARIDDAVEKAVQLECLSSEVDLKKLELISVMERETALLRLRRELAERASAS